MTENCVKVFNSIIFLQSVLLSVEYYEATSVISTPAGKFRGAIREFEVFGETKTVEKFLGIPYAESPVRFRKAIIKAPMSPETIYDATEYRPSCSQQEMVPGGVRNPRFTIETAEDCLFLNIVKPKLENTGKELPVMVWLHGGGFVLGSPQLYPGDMLTAWGEVIVVTISYRLSLWGFMSTGDEILQGNLGLWDQHIALMWIHENIKDFGGDSDTVTIFGASAGSASVLYQSLFPANLGFFQRAIGISGSITCPWSFQSKPLDVTVRFGSLLGCDTKASVKDLVRCIESKPAEELNLVLNRKENGYLKFPMEFVTVIDGEFLMANPYKIISAETELSSESIEFFGSIDYMTGVSLADGAMNICPFAGIDDTEGFTLTREEFERKSVPEAVKLIYGDSVPNVVSDVVIHEYTDWENPETIANTRNSFLDMTGDYGFKFHAKLLADMHANLSSVTSGRGNTFAYQTEAFPSQHLVWTPTWLLKPNHIDDLTFLFGYDKEGFLLGTEPYSEAYRPAEWELQVSKLYMTLFSNFAKSGDPNKPVNVEDMIHTVWPQYDSVFGKYLAINRTMSKLSVKENFCAKSFNLWYSLIPDIIETSSHSAGRTSYFQKRRADSCDVDGGCP